MAERQPTLREALDDANPSNAWDYLRKLRLGMIIQQLAVWLFSKDPAASLYQLATLEAVVLPDLAKASHLKSAYARVGGVTGDLVIVANRTTPGSGEAAIAPNGDIVTLAADAITALDLEYEPMAQYEVAEETLVVTANDLTFPTTGKYLGKTIIAVLECEALTGGVTGKNIILKAGARSVTTKQANLNIAKTKVLFVAADAVTKAKVKFAYSSDVDVAALLAATAPF